MPQNPAQARYRSDVNCFDISPILQSIINKLNFKVLFCLSYISLLRVALSHYEIITRQDSQFSFKK